MTPRELVLEQIHHRETAQIPYTLTFDYPPHPPLTPPPTPGPSQEGRRGSYANLPRANG